MHFLRSKKTSQREEVRQHEGEKGKGREGMRKGVWAVCVYVCCMCVCVHVYACVSMMSLCMCVHVCAYAHVCVWWVCVHMCVHLCVLVCMSMSVHVHVCICVYVCMHVCPWWVCACMCVYVCVSECVCRRELEGQAEKQRGGNTDTPPPAPGGTPWPVAPWVTPTGEAYKHVLQQNSLMVLFIHLSFGSLEFHFQYRFKEKHGSKRYMYYPR